MNISPQVLTSVSTSNGILGNLEDTIGQNIKDPFHTSIESSSILKPEQEVVVQKLDHHVSLLLTESTSKLRLIQHSQSLQLRKQKEISLGGMEASRDLYRQVIGVLSVITFLLYVFL